MELYEVPVELKSTYTIPMEMELEMETECGRKEGNTDENLRVLRSESPNKLGESIEQLELRR